MISFGQSKNSLYLLQSTLRKMGYFQQNNNNSISPRQFQYDKFINNNDNNIAMLIVLLNYALIQYSTDIFKQLLDIVPNLRVKNDYQFVKSCMTISRDYFSVNPGITVQQFLSNGFMAKKLEFVANLTKATYNKAEIIRKYKNKENKIQNKDIKKIIPQFPQFQNTYHQQNQGHFHNQNKIDIDSDEQQVPMKIAAKPMKIDFDQINSLQKKLHANKQKSNKMINTKNKSNDGEKLKFNINGQTFYDSEIKAALEQKHTTPTNQTVKNSNKQKNGQQKRAYKLQNQNQVQKQENEKYRKYRISQQKNITPNPQHFNSIQNKNSRPKGNQEAQILQQVNKNYVTKHQFNELFSLMKVMSQTVNQITVKFNDLQNSVSTQINNINARVLMLESTVRLLKDNL